MYRIARGRVGRTLVAHNDKPFRVAFYLIPYNNHTYRCIITISSYTTQNTTIPIDCMYYVYIYIVYCTANQIFPFDITLNGCRDLAGGGLGHCLAPPPVTTTTTATRARREPATGRTAAARRDPPPTPRAVSLILPPPARRHHHCTAISRLAYL